MAYQGGGTCQQRNRLRRATAPLSTVNWSTFEGALIRNGNLFIAKNDQWINFDRYKLSMSHK